MLRVSASAGSQWHSLELRAGVEQSDREGELMRLEGWNPMLFLAMLLTAVVVVVVVTLIVRWTLRAINRRNDGGGSESSPG